MKDTDQTKESTATASVYPEDTQPTSLKRNITGLSAIGIGMSICNGWAAMSSTIVIGLAQGGTAVVLYGLVFTSLVNLFLAGTLGELAAAYPSAGGQYIWSSILASPKRRRGISFFVGWTTIFSWITIVASVVIISAEVVYSLVETYHPSFNLQRWMVFLVFQAVNTISLFANLFALSDLPRMGTFFLCFSTIIFVAILVTCVAAAPTHNTNHFVWSTYTNEIGWSNAFVVVATGIVNPGYVYAGLDGAIHIAEDCQNPARAVPYALFATVGMAFFTGITMSIGLLYSVQDLATATESELPFLTIIVQATQSKAAGTVFMTFFLMVLVISSNSVHHATSRLIWSFARDRGMPFSGQLKNVHPRLRVPIYPILLSYLGVTILGALYVASVTVYGSIIACCIILGNLSFAVPAFQLLLNRRRINSKRWLKLGVFGWLCNIVTILWCVFTTVMWLFPLTPNPTPGEMNYSVAVLGGMGLIGLADWVFYARKHYIGPDLTNQRFVLETAEQEVYEK